MAGIGEDFYTPVMYQDLANPFMGQMSYPIGGMGMGGMAPMAISNTSYLNGAKIKSQANEDEFLNHRKNSDKKDMSIIKKATLIFAGCLALGCIKPCKNAIKLAGGLGKFVSAKWTNLKKWVETLYKSNKP